MERPIELILMHLRSELTPETEMELQAWRKESEENEQFFLGNTNEDALIEGLKLLLMSDAEIQMGWKEMRAKIKRREMISRLKKM